ncbi:MAG: ribonuclease H-like domain-containing protein [Lysobacterales bacterium]
MDHRRLRERLAAQRSAGDSPVLATAAVPAVEVFAEVDWHARVAHLRGLIRARRQRLEGAVPDLTGPADASPVAGTVATVRAFEDPAMDLGEAVADGVRQVERSWPASPQLPDPGGHGQVCCFDTETTGLRGGAGLWVWMVGALRWTGERWRLRQWWLQRPGAETAYLTQVLAELQAGSGPLVSFNGKSYDLPHLGTRLALQGWDNPLPSREHLDLLHLLRRRHGREWPDCRLRTAESRLLGLRRIDDLPGSEAPRSWRDWLQYGHPRGIAQVLAHNRQDLLSLARLLPLLSEQAAA